MCKTRTVLFLCTHGAAKSVLAAAYFRRLAAQRGLDVHSDAAGTEPDDEVSPAVAELLRAEGVDVTSFRPRRVTSEDLATADQVVSLGCDLENLTLPGVTVIRWDNVPPVSVNLLAARDAIRAHVESLLDAL